MLHRPSSLKDISSPISQFNAHMPLSLIIEKGHINAGTNLKTGQLNFKSQSPRFELMRR